MNSTSLLAAGTIAIFAATAAGTYVGRTIPTHADNTLKEASVTPSGSTAGATAPDQRINEKSDGVMTSLDATDYYAAAMACGSYDGAEILQDPNRMVTMLDGSKKPASQFSAPESPEVKKAKATRDTLFAAAIKAVGGDPANCLRWKP